MSSRYIRLIQSEAIKCMIMLTGLEKDLLSTVGKKQFLFAIINAANIFVPLFGHNERLWRDIVEQFVF